MKVRVEEEVYEVGPLLALMVELLCSQPELERSLEGSCSFSWHARDVVFEVRAVRVRRQLPRLSQAERG